VIARHVLRALAVDAADDAAQHRRGVDAADGGIVFDAVEEGLKLVGLDIDEEVGGRDLRQVPLDRGAQVGVDLAHGRQHGEAEAEGQNHRCRIRSRPADRAERSAQRRAPPDPTAARETAGQRADATRRQGQQQERAEDARRRAKRERGMPESVTASPTSTDASSAITIR
jgi:hypothetical protein